MERDRRLTGWLRGQTDNPEAPDGFELNNPWKVSGQLALCYLVFMELSIIPARDSIHLDVPAAINSFNFSNCSPDRILLDAVQCDTEVILQCLHPLALGFQYFNFFCLGTYSPLKILLQDQDADDILSLFATRYHLAANNSLRKEGAWTAAGEVVHYLEISKPELGLGEAIHVLEIAI